MLIHKIRDGMHLQDPRDVDGKYECSLEVKESSRYDHEIRIILYGIFIAIFWCMLILNFFRYVLINSGLCSADH